MSVVEELRTSLEGAVRENVPLAPFTTFRIGGNAAIYIEPLTASDIAAVQRIVSTHHLPLFILGNGSNVLISDEGWNGVVVNLQDGFTDLSIDGSIVCVGAGVRMAAFVDFAIRHSRKGVEMLPGIPATLGGAIWMNAGCYGGETSDFLLDVTLVRNGEVLTIPKAECGFSYRHSGFQPGDIVTGARFDLPEGNPAELREIKLKHLLHRNNVQPVNLPNCGSVFKNPKPRFSAELIESAGLKGTTIGGAQISPKHANFIVNIHSASASDVVALMNLARKKVFETTGIVLEPEVQLVGFERSPITDLP